MAAISEACPKCATPRGDGQQACARCGLAASRMGTFATERDASIPDALVAAWDRATEAWEDPARHDEVIRLVAQHDAYAWAAARYRTRADDAMGERQLARVRKAAEATMMATAIARKDKAPKPYRGLIAILVMLIIAAGAGLLYANAMRDGPEPDPNAAKPAPPLGGQPAPLAPK